MFVIRHYKILQQCWPGTQRERNNRESTSLVYWQLHHNDTTNTAPLKTQCWVISGTARPGFPRQ